MSSENYDRNAANYSASYRESDGGGAEDPHVEAAINDEAYIRWQENGRDQELEHVVERMTEEFETKRHLDDADPGKPDWVTAVQETARRRAGQE